MEDPGRFDRSGEKAPGQIIAIAKFVTHYCFCNIQFIFFSVKENGTNQASPAAMPDRHQTPIRRGPAGCPVLLGKGALSATRYAQTSTFQPAQHAASADWRFLALACDARRVLKGKFKTEMNVSPL
jgi:hypothetical protein